MAANWTPPELPDDVASHKDAALRRQRRDRSFVLRWVLLAIVAVAWAIQIGRARLRPRVSILGPNGNFVHAQLELFELDRSPSAPSPTPRIGEAESVEEDEVWIDVDVGPDGCLARVRSAGLGLGVAFIEAEGTSLPVKLAPAPRVRGRVTAVGGSPVAHAEVLLLGGGPRGVPLVTTSTDGGGDFVIDEVSPTVTLWHFRVFAPGYALGDLDWPSDEEVEPWIVLQPTLPARGKLVASDVIPLGGLPVRGFQVPGLNASTGPDGSFEFEAPPPAPMVIHPVIDGLPAGFTYQRVSMQAGRETKITVVRGERVTGRVVDGITGRPIAGARVFHEHGPRCVVATRSDADGHFDLSLVPPGFIEIRAVVDRQRPGNRSNTPTLVQAVETVEVEGGVPVPPIVLRVE